MKKIIARGINGLIGPYFCPHQILKTQYFDVWHTMLKEAGRADLQMAHNEFIYVGESDAQVKADVKDHVLWYVRTAAKIWGERDKSKVAEQFANYTEILEYFDTVSFDEIYDKLGIFGTPDSVAEKIEWLNKEGGLEHLITFSWFGKLAHEKSMRSMELFAREVMPRFQKPAAQTATG